MQLLVADWAERLAAEQRARSAELMQAALGSDGRLVDERLLACEELDVIRKLAVALADRLAVRRTVDGGVA